MTRRTQTVPAARRLVRFLRQKGKDLSPLLILTHDHPDPDAVASALALAHLARALGGARCRIAHGGVVGRVENQTMVRLLKIPLHPLRRGSDLRRFRSVALVDTQPGFGNNPFPTGAQAALVVDHHPPIGKSTALCSAMDPYAGATSVILAQALLRAGVGIPSDLATALAYGILSETQTLGRQTREVEIRTYLELVPLCDLRCLSLIQNPQRPPEFFRVLKRALEGAFVTGDIIGAHLGWVQAPDVISQAADLLLTYEGMRWSVCTGRYKGRIHISLRALRPACHTGRLLQKVLREKTLAGGHWSMAGGSVPGPRPSSEKTWRKMESRLVRELCRRVHPGRPDSALPDKRRFLRFPFRRRA